MGQIPRSTERISSFHHVLYSVLIFVFSYMYFVSLHGYMYISHCIEQFRIS